MAQYGLEMLEAYLLQQGHRVKLVDAQIEDIGVEDIVEEISDSNLKNELVGISALPSSISLLEEVLSKLNSKVSFNKKTPLVIGGYIVTHYADSIFNLEGGSLVDAIVFGKGEEALGKIVSSYQNSSNLSDISNISFQNEGEVYTTPRSPVNIINLPWSTRSLSLRLKEKSQSDLSVLRIYKSAGCLNFCSFCNIHDYIYADRTLGKEETKKQLWVTRTPEDVVNEVVFLHEKFGTKTFDFVDDDALGSSPEDWLKISNLLDDAGISDEIEYWISAKLMKFAESKEVIRRMSDSGLMGIFLGFESPTYRVLKELNKAATIDGRSFSSEQEYLGAFHESIELAKDLGLKLKLGNINILADSTFEEVKSSIQFICDNDILYNVESVIRPIGIFGDTLIKRKYQRKGYIKATSVNDDWQNNVRFCYNFKDPQVNDLFNYWQSYNVPTFLFRMDLLRRTYLQKDGSKEMIYFKKLRDIDFTVAEGIIQAINNDGPSIDGIISGSIEKVKRLEEEFYERF